MSFNSHHIPKRWGPVRKVRGKLIDLSMSHSLFLTPSLMGCKAYTLPTIHSWLSLNFLCDLKLVLNLLGSQFSHLKNEG